MADDKQKRSPLDRGTASEDEATQTGLADFRHPAFRCLGACQWRVCPSLAVDLLAQSMCFSEKAYKLDLLLDHRQRDLQPARFVVRGEWGRLRRRHQWIVLHSSRPQESVIICKMRHHRFAVCCARACPCWRLRSRHTAMSPRSPRLRASTVRRLALILSSHAAVAALVHPRLTHPAAVLRRLSRPKGSRVRRCGFVALHSGDQRQSWRARNGMNEQKVGLK
jgi:hypothetical protein